MNYFRENQRAVTLGIILLSLLVLIIWPKGFSGSLYIISVAVFSGLVAALIFIKSSVKELKEIAEEMVADDPIHGAH